MASTIRASSLALALWSAGCTAPSLGPDAGDVVDTCPILAELDAGPPCAGPSCGTCVPDGGACPPGCTPIHGTRLEREGCCWSQSVLASCYDYSRAGELTSDVIVCAVRERDGAVFELPMFPSAAWASAGLLPCPGMGVRTFSGIPDCDERQ